MDGNLLEGNLPMISPVIFYNVSCAWSVYSNFLVPWLLLWHRPAWGRPFLQPLPVKTVFTYKYVLWLNAACSYCGILVITITLFGTAKYLVFTLGKPLKDRMTNKHDQTLMRRPRRD